jgi:hypothetical protein
MYIPRDTAEEGSQGLEGESDQRTSRDPTTDYTLHESCEPPEWRTQPTILSFTLADSWIVNE